MCRFHRDEGEVGRGLQGFRFQSGLEMAGDREQMVAILISRRLNSPGLRLTEQVFVAHRRHNAGTCMDCRKQTGTLGLSSSSSWSTEIGDMSLDGGLAFYKCRWQTYE